jgi:hypothetical protein
MLDALSYDPLIRVSDDPQLVEPALRAPDDKR